MKQLFTHLRIVFILVILFFSFSATAQTTYYVNDNSTAGDVFTTAVGNDANIGTASAPFATIDYAYELAEPGDTIYVDAGEYFYTGEVFIQKGITFLGVNYNRSPNDATDAKNPNTDWTAETKVSGATLTILSNDLRFKGFTFNPGLRTAVSLNNSPTSNNNFGNLVFENNRFIVTQTSSQVILVGVGTGSTQASALINSGFTISNNRFEKSALGAGSVFSVHLVKNVTINNNAFVIGTGGAIRTATAISMGNVGVVDNVSISNNTVDRFQNFVSGNQYSSATITANKIYNTINAVTIGNSMTRSSNIQIVNNLFDGTGGILPFINYSRNNGNTPGSSTILNIENNIFISTAVPSVTTLLGAILVQYNSIVLNPSLTIKANKITMGGDLSTVDGQNIRPINLRGNLGNATIENNEITLSGINVQPRNPAISLPVCPAITLSPENGVNAVLQSSAVVNIHNNKVQGFKHSFVVFDPSAGANPYIGFGNLPFGATVNVNNNSFTGDSMSINHSNVGEVVNASCNWYGSAAVQNFISKLALEANLDILPWLTNGTDNDPATGFQPVPGSCDGYPTLITLNSSTNVTCNGAANGTINVSTSYGKAPFTYTWTKDDDANFVSNNEDLTNLAPGTYRLAITDGNGSNIYIIDENADGPGVIVVTITEPDVLTATPSGDNNICFNGTIGTASVDVTGGTAPYTYLWNNGATASEISNLAAGVYSVTVTDANGCTTTASYEVTQPTQVTATIANNSTACSNIATVTAGGGTPGYTYLWSNGSTAATISGVPVGTYNVTVTDNNGCTATASLNLTVAEAFNPSASVTDITCFGASNGIITVTNVNGTAPFLFSKDGGVTFVAGTIPFSFTNLAPGTYNIAVKDANGCTGFVERTVTEPSQLTATYTVQNTCAGFSTGSINVTVNGGSPAYSYSWTGLNGTYSSTQLNISNLAVGNYTLTVTDKNNCTVVLPVTVNPFPAITIARTITDVACRGGATGSINITATGGTGSGFTYSWTGPDVTSNEDLSNLAKGTYKIRVTDIGSGCIVDSTFIVSEPASNLSLTTTRTNATGCNSLGTITGTGSGGTAPYSYNLNGGAYNNFTGLFTGLYAGSYTIGVKDANGCTTTKVVSITDNGGDEYEGTASNKNNTKAKAFTIPIETVIYARIPTVADSVDWYKFTTAGAGGYTVTFNHPNPAIVFDVYTAIGDTLISTLAGSTTNSKKYNFSAGKVYNIKVYGGLSYICYSLTVSAGIAARANNNQIPITENKSNPVLNADVLKAMTYPNPHRGAFTLRIESPEDGIGTVEMYNANGQLLGERKVNLVKGKGNMVQYNNINHAVLFYRVHIGKHIVNGKIIGAN